MATHVLRIDPDGAVTKTDYYNSLDAGKALYDSTSVVTCRHPLLDDGIHVGVIDDFGADSLPTNRKAWALYGRSAIFGTMFLARDDRESLWDGMIETVTGPIESWVGSEILSYMDLALPSATENAIMSNSPTTPLFWEVTPPPTAPVVLNVMPRNEALTTSEIHNRLPDSPWSQRTTILNRLRELEVLGLVIQDHNRPTRWLKIS